MAKLFLYKVFGYTAQPLKGGKLYHERIYTHSATRAKKEFLKQHPNAKVQVSAERVRTVTDLQGTPYVLDAHYGIKTRVKAIKRKVRHRKGR